MLFTKENVALESYKLETIAEGWGLVAINILAQAPGTNKIAGQIGQAIALSKLQKLMSNPIVTKYIKDFMGNKFKELKKTRPSLQTKVTAGFWKRLILAFKDESGDKADERFLQVLKNIRAEDNIGGYMVTYMGDTDHIEKVVGWFYDADDNRYVRVNIPSPTKQDLIDAGYKPED